MDGAQGVALSPWVGQDQWGLVSGGLLVFWKGREHRNQVCFSNRRSLPKLALLTATLLSFGYCGAVSSALARRCHRLVYT